MVGFLVSKMGGTSFELHDYQADFLAQATSPSLQDIVDRAMK